MADASALIGQVFDGRYRIEAEVGRGSMATVFRAVHESMQQTVALKVLTEIGPGDDARVARFTTEARACSRLRHPNTIRVFDFGRSPEGLLYLAMEYLEGEPLGRLLAREAPLPPTRAVAIIRQAAKSLGEAHRAGLVHRDLKPDNLFLTDVFGEKDFVKVLDFGVAKILENPTGDEPMTQAGVVLGTPLYLSPEQALGRDLDGRTDLYALGALLYEMLAGRPPFRAPSPIAVVMQHIHDAVPPLAATLPGIHVPPALEALVMRLLSKDREDRPASAEALLEALDSAMAGVPAAAAAPPPVPPAPAAPPPVAPAPATPPDTKPMGSLDLDAENDPGARTMILLEEDVPPRPPVPSTPPAPPVVPTPPAGRPESRVTHDWGTGIPVAPRAVPARGGNDDEGIVFSAEEEAGSSTVLLPRTEIGPLLEEARTAMDMTGASRTGASPGSRPAASARPAPSKGVPWAIVAGVVAVLVLASIGAWALLGGRGTVDPAAPAAAVAPTPAAPVPAPAPAPNPAPAAAAAPTPQPLAAAVSVLTTPPAAEVLQEGNVVGRTPYALRLRDGDPAVRLMIRAPGFQALEVTLVPRDVIESGRTTFTYDLAREPPPERKPAPGAPRPSDRPAVEPRAEKAPATAEPPKPAAAPKPTKKPVLNWDE